MSVFIAISGNIGSGKTTLAKIISQNWGWQYLPLKRIELTYLNDLFNNPKRWSFESQINFLSSKAENIRWAINLDKSIVLDRSIYEDVSIFANYFYREGDMDERAYDTYCQVTQHFIETLPIPDLLIYCACSPSICRQRLANRQTRSFEKSYPPNHVEKLWQIYEDWIDKFNSCPAVSIDTEKYDIRDPEITHKILNGIQTILTEGLSENDRQLDLFENPERFNNGINTTIINRINDVPFQSKDSFEVTVFPWSKKPKIHRSVYVAAPFTQYAQESSQPNHIKIQDSLFEFKLPHGIISSSEYKRNLSNIAKAFKHLGFEPLLPHRDINVWGTKVLTPDKIVKQCRKAVAQSDLFFGIFGVSLGVHFEAGIAAGLEKPIILAKVKQIEDSFFAKGIAELTNSIVINAEVMSEIPSLLKSKEIESFLKNHGIL